MVGKQARDRPGTAFRHERRILAYVIRVAVQPIARWKTRSPGGIA
jgi:hypothetical protein